MKYNKNQSKKGKTYTIIPMNIEEIILSEITVMKGKILFDSSYIRYLAYCSQIHRDKKENGDCQGKSKGELVFNEYRIKVLEDEKMFQRQMVVMVVQQCECT